MSADRESTSPRRTSMNFPEQHRDNHKDTIMESSKYTYAIFYHQSKMITIRVPKPSKEDLALGEINYQKRYEAACALLDLAFGVNGDRSSNVQFITNDPTIIFDEDAQEDNVINPARFYTSDITINGYMTYLKNRNPLIYVYDSYFFNTLIERGVSGVMRWAKNEKIFTKQKLFFPIFIKGTNHWALVYIDLQRKLLNFYDSLSKANIYSDNLAAYCLKPIYSYLEGKYKETYNKMLCTGWLLNYMYECPQQKNGYDCGIFVCKFVEYLSVDAPLDFTQEDMPKFRQEIFSTVYPEQKLEGNDSNN